ncbi:MAG TPA: HAD-IIIA family hydrolase [Gemmatimonadaceae bacterium]
MSGRPAAFLDRDDTIISEARFVRDPADVRLIPSAAPAIGRLNARGIVVIVVTNQSGIARGIITLEEYQAVQKRTEDVVAAGGGRIDDTYMCPHYPEISGPCNCRKPGLLMYQRAIADHGLDPKRSLFCGDRWRDVAASVKLGGLGIMLDVPSTTDEDRERAQRDGIETAHSLSEAVDRYLATLPAPNLEQ